jgi:flagellar hook-basal body complex protein FliE
MAAVTVSPVATQVLADLAQMRNLAAGLDMPSLNPHAEAATGSFADSMKQALMSVNEQDHAAAGRMAEVDAGRSDDLVGAMLASQEASLSFSMLMQVRNKVVGAMDELIKLQL